MTIEIEFNGTLTSDEAARNIIERHIESELVGSEFTVHTDDSRDEAVKEYIRETIWAFVPGFLEGHMPEGVTTDVIEILQEKCEGANAPLLAMIEDFDDFVEDAVSADGYGHFLSHYDGEEHEVSVDGELYFIYRQN